MFEKALDHFKKTDPILFELGKSINSLAINLETQDHFKRLVRAIVGQQLSVKAAHTIYSRFEKLFPKLQITPEKIIKLDKEKLRSCGISYSKIGYIKDLSQIVIDKKLVLETIHKEDDETVIKNLMIVKGIGPWSAEMFLMFALERPDIFSAGDRGLQNAMKKLYGLKNPSKERLIKISNKWSPYKTYACMILWKSLDNEPK